MKFFNLLCLILVSVLTFSYMPKVHAADQLGALSCHQLKTQLNALSAKMRRTATGNNNNTAVGDVIWGGLVGQQIKKSNGSVSNRVSQLKQAYSQKCSS